MRENILEIQNIFVCIAEEKVLQIHLIMDCISMMKMSLEISMYVHYVTE